MYIYAGCKQSGVAESIGIITFFAFWFCIYALSGTKISHFHFRILYVINFALSHVIRAHCPGTG